MIDFVSTRIGASPQDKACARLLTSIIVQAVRDASLPISAEERHQHKNLSVRAREGLRFLFHPDSVVSAYARLIGSSADAIRKGLLTAEGGAMPDVQRRALRMRHALLTPGAAR